MSSSVLPDIFVLENGCRVRSHEDWQIRRKEIYKTVVDFVYGGMPPVPSFTSYEELHTTSVKWLDGVKLINLRIMPEVDINLSFVMYLYIPKSEGPLPVLIYGDDCWSYLTDKVISEVMKRNIILAVFNRVEIAPDNKSSERTAGIYRKYSDIQFGALSAWAWGYHRCVDVLTEMKEVDSSKIAITGHSRGGKTVLLAAATDERISLTNPNNSGLAGAGSFRYRAEGSGAIADTIRNFPYWYGPEFKNYVGRENELIFDQHYLKALVAPRGILSTEALGDLWANPKGTLQVHYAAQEVYKFLGAENQINIHYREGVHEHNFIDWCILLDCIEWQLCGSKSRSAISFNSNPFPDMKKAFDWECPECPSVY